MLNTELTSFMARLMQDFM